MEQCEGLAIKSQKEKVQTHDIAEAALGRFVQDIAHFVPLRKPDELTLDGFFRGEEAAYSKFWAATNGLRSFFPFLPSMAWISPQAPPRYLLCAKASHK